MTDNIEELRALLEEAEWASTDWEETACPWCYGLKNYEGHASDCRWVEAMR